MSSFCLTCTNKTCLDTGKPCKRVRDYMRKHGIYSADWIRPEVSPKKRNKEGNVYSRYREIPFSALKTRNYDGDFTHNS